jgi:IstB-like ATP binding protein
MITSRLATRRRTHLHTGMRLGRIRHPVWLTFKLYRAPRAPSPARSAERLAERARAESWTHEELLAGCLEREVAARQSNGGELRIRTTRFPARQTLEEFHFDHQQSLRRDVIAHLAALDFVEAKDKRRLPRPRGAAGLRSFTYYRLQSTGS